MLAADYDSRKAGTASSSNPSSTKATETEATGKPAAKNTAPKGKK
jgi:hypothetical protein